MKGINFLNRLRSKFIKKQNSNNTELTFNDRLIEDWGNPDIYGPWTRFMNNQDNKLFYKEYYLVSYNDNIDVKKIHERIMKDKRREKLEIRRKKLLNLQYFK